MKILRNLSRIAFLQSQLTYKELFFILSNFIFNKKKLSKNIIFSQLSVFINHSDNHFKAEKIGIKNNLNFFVNNIPLIIQLRRKTSDYFIFEQVFIRNDYSGLIFKVLAEMNSTSVKFIIDAGANIGASALFLHSYFPKAKIISIEPELSNFNQLQLNVGINSKENNIISFQGALWNKEEKLSLKNDFRDKSHHSFNISKEIHGEISQANGISVDGLMKKYNFPYIDILKMDIEGSEKSIFEDKPSLDLFLKLTKFIAVEIHEEMISKAEVMNILKEYDFECFESGEYCIAVNKSIDYK